MLAQPTTARGAAARGGCRDHRGRRRDRGSFATNLASTGGRRWCILRNLSEGQLRWVLASISDMLVRGGMNIYLLSLIVLSMK
eukprot:COSAG01_NODE_495_length_16308_cov_92.317088_4_plen_83_part_00